MAFIKTFTAKVKQVPVTEIEKDLQGIEQEDKDSKDIELKINMKKELKRN